MIDAFEYQGHKITLVPVTIKKKMQYWFVIDGRPITFCVDPEYAKSMAIRYIDTIYDDYHRICRQSDTTNLLNRNNN